MIISLSQKEKPSKLSGGSDNHFFLQAYLSNLRTYGAGCLLASPVFSSNSNGIESSVSGVRSSKYHIFSTTPAFFISKLNQQRRL
jgi:hypothetical protein